MVRIVRLEGKFSINDWGKLRVTFNTTFVALTDSRWHYKNRHADRIHAYNQVFDLLTGSANSRDRQPTLRAYTELSRRGSFDTKHALASLVSHGLVEDGRDIIGGRQTVTTGQRVLEDKSVSECETATAELGGD